MDGVAEVEIDDTTYEIPGVFEVSIEHHPIGSHQRTAGGQMLMNVVAVKRVWTLETRALSKAEVDAFLDPLIAKNFQYVGFRTDDMGALVDAYLEVSVERDLESAASKEGGRTVRIIATER